MKYEKEGLTTCGCHFTVSGTERHLDRAEADAAVDILNNLEARLEEAREKQREECAMAYLIWMGVPESWCEQVVQKIRNAGKPPKPEPRWCSHCYLLPKDEKMVWYHGVQESGVMAILIPNDWGQCPVKGCGAPRPEVEG